MDIEFLTSISAVARLLSSCTANQTKRESFHTSSQRSKESIRRCQRITYAFLAFIAFIAFLGAAAAAFAAFLAMLLSTGKD